MTDPTPEMQRDAARADLARLRAGLAAGLTPEQSARLQGSTDEEFAADAVAFAAELGGDGSAPAGNRVGGPRGGDVGAATGVERGAEEYRAKHPKRESRPLPTGTNASNPFAVPTYVME
ncbi:hypothetical protein ACFQ9Q_02030 [Streptomyces virginiae]|uniref:hypothetical protein n=1 Tax=Streptomyces virginiae TaxID=1961 RepID=UPI0036896B5C